MECPYCEHELEYYDYYGRIAAHQDGHKEGEIFKCVNENCEMFEESFHNHLDREQV